MDGQVDGRVVGQMACQMGRKPDRSLPRAAGADVSERGTPRRRTNAAPRGSGPGGGGLPVPLGFRSTDVRAGGFRTGLYAGTAHGGPGEAL